MNDESISVFTSDVDVRNLVPAWSTGTDEGLRLFTQTRSTIIDREAAKADPPLTISPEGMYRSQLNGKACINCNKGWPAPRVQVGVFVGGGRAMACPECAPVVVAE